jgi:hypothetical protein
MAFILSNQMIRQTVEIFKTNVQNASEASAILATLSEIYPALRINFDLDDCDNILRVEGLRPDVDRIQKHVQGLGFSCEVLG